MFVNMLSQMLMLRNQMDNLVQKLKENSPDLKKNFNGKAQLCPWSLSASLQEQREFSSQLFDESSLFGDCIPGIALEDITEGTGLETFDTDTECKS